jgi:diacylglycerol kinase (ATP)
MFLKILNHTKQRAIWSWEGFVHVLITEKSVYQWVFANIISFLAAMAMPISAAERSLLIMGGIFILAMECMNTAVERVVDDISQDKRELAKQAKDTASAAVALSAIAVGSAWIVIVVGVLR